ncbi:MAG: molybdopterin-guanine dinucleotide biosynthesis protein B, partial [Candidatus Competibacterales bacterium]
MALIHTPLLGIAAFSGTGKTTLLRRIIPALKTPMGPVGLIKHTHHRFEVDWPGKDSHRLARAGAAQTLVASPLRRAVISHYPTAQPAALEDHLATLDDGSLGLILVEGYKRKPLPKLELHRPSLGHPLLAHDDPSVVAIACDAPLEAPPVEVL